MTKEQWLKICELNMLWYYIQIFEDEDKARKYAKEHMPDFNDGRVEFFQANFNKL